MGIFDLTAATGALKELYDDQKVNNMVYARNPALALVKKQKDFGGKYFPQPIITATGQGRSGVFATAQANQSAAVIPEFLVTRKRDYAVASIDNETMLAMETDKMSFIRGAQTVIDTQHRAITNSLASGLFRAGTGSIGVVGAVSTSGTGPYVMVLTLSNANDSVQFERNMAVVAAATDGGAVTTELGLITKVDRVKGILTLSFAVNPSGTWAAGAFLSVQGDVNAKISGFAAWIPQVAPSAGDSFYGVDRSSDPTRLAGITYDGSQQPLEEAMIDACALLGREDGEPDTLFTNFASYAAFEKAAGAKVNYVDMMSDVGIGFTGIMINGAASKVKVIADRNCQPLTGYLLTMSSWTLHTLGDAPQVLKYGLNQDWLRIGNADAAELRLAYYGNLRCEAPGWNANIKLSA